MASKSISLVGMCCRRTCQKSRQLSLNLTRFTHKYPPGSAPPLKPSRYMAIYRDLHGAIEEPTAAKDFVYALDKRERQLLRAELENFEKSEKQAEETVATKPTASQLKAVALHNTIPFIGFGFLDNLLMIIAGEYIELQFGAILGISTMAAAALGNWVSDLAGVQTVHYIEKISSLYGVKAPALTPQQVDMSSTRWASNMGKALGVSIGCIIGMFPLLFYKNPKDREEEKEESPS